MTPNQSSEAANRVKLQKWNLDVIKRFNETVSGPDNELGQKTRGDVEHGASHVITTPGLPGDTTGL